MLMRDNVIKVNFPSGDFTYMVTEDNQIVGVSGKNVDMEMSPEDDGGFYFNGNYISRSELLALVLVSGLWEECTGESDA